GGTSTIGFGEASGPLFLPPAADSGEGCGDFPGRAARSEESSRRRGARSRGRRFDRPMDSVLACAPRLGYSQTPLTRPWWVRPAIGQANDEIIAMGALDRDLRNMGTTVVLAAWRKGNELFVAGVGDSRAYMIRNGSIEQLTVDHSLAQALVEAKTISAEEAREHRFRNVLWKYLGSKEVGEGPEVKAVAVQSGDKFVLCTDGLTGVVPDDKILECVRD